MRREQWAEHDDCKLARQERDVAQLGHVRLFGLAPALHDLRRLRADEAVHGYLRETDGGDRNRERATCGGADR